MITSLARLLPVTLACWAMCDLAQAECTSRLVGPYDGIVSGAATQCLVLDVEGCDAAKPDQLPAGTSVQLATAALPSKIMRGAVRDECLSGAARSGLLGVEVRNAPEGLPDTPMVWELRAKGSVITSMEPSVLPAIKAGDVHVLYAAELNLQHANGLVPPDSAGARRLIRDPLASVDPQPGDDAWGLENVVEVKLPRSRPVTQPPSYWCVESQGAGYLLDQQRRPFGVEGRASTDEGGTSARAVVTDSVRVVVPSSSSGTLSLRLLGIVGAAPDVASRQSENAACTPAASAIIFDSGLQTLSTSFEVQSIPLPFRDHTVLLCQAARSSDYVSHAGGIIAPQLKHLNTCQLCYSPSPTAEGFLCEPIRSVTAEAVREEAALAVARAKEATDVGKGVLIALRTQLEGKLSGHVEEQAEVKKTTTFQAFGDAWRGALKVEAGLAKQAAAEGEVAEAAERAVVAARAAAVAAKNAIAVGADRASRADARSAARDAETRATQLDAAVANAVGEVSSESSKLAKLLRDVALKARAAATTTVPLERFDDLRAQHLAGALGPLGEHEYRHRRRMAYYGKQTLKIELVDGEGTAIRDAKSWTLDATEFYELPLELERLSKKDEIYIRVSLNAAHSAANYPVRLVKKDDAAGSLDDANVDYRFSVGVLHRGSFGMPVPLRIFATASVVPFALRFPAPSSSLASSSESRAVQHTSGVLNALLVAEPWDWRRRQNPWFGLRAGTGMRVLEAKEGFAPSFLVGASLSLPIFDAPSQLGTAISFWTFYELDLVDNRSYALLTLSVDVLTLFSGNSESSGPAGTKN